MKNFFDPEIVEFLTAGQLAKSVNMYIGRMMFRRLSGINQAYYLGHSLYFHDDIYYDRNFLEQLQNVSPEQVKQMAEKYLSYSNTVTVVVR
jgi:predicted Zn-dependent peptidase